MNLVWHQSSVSQLERASLKQQTPCVIWFTGLSASGKSSIANAVDRLLFESGYHTYLLDGDNVRHGLSRDLGFSNLDRVENIRRIGEVSALFSDAGLIVLSAFISPFISDREMVRQLLPDGYFVEVFVDTPLSVCEKRDPKGIYKKARIGEIKNFTGIDSPYEIPTQPEIHIKTDRYTIEESARSIIQYLCDKGYIQLDALSDNKCNSLRGGQPV